ncbi:N-acetyltransferase family protein [Nocardioides sp.]|uniref:GNAT family N-acetyltransferase n=1 Tax=Nocardioides sp. TaxID=35761 RepID=UPI003D0BAF2F
MARRTAPLTVDRLADLPTACRACLFWELDPVRRQRVPSQDAAEEKQGWVSEVLREWGSCGRVALVDDMVVGYVIYAPAPYVPGADSFPTAPVSADAVVMTTLYVDPAHRHGGIGRLLVQGMARDLIQRGGIRAVEAFTDTRGRSGHCMVPTEFCRRVGFKTQRAHTTRPRMRMDLRSVLTWRDEVEQALEKLLGVVRPIVHPAPKASRPSARGTN